MNKTERIQQIIDQLIYNRSYAPDYPSEDHTSLEKEKARIFLWLDETIKSAGNENSRGWLALSRLSVVEGFSKLQHGEQVGGSSDISFAVQYLRNALRNKTRKIDFVCKSEGVIITCPEEGNSKN